MIASRCDGVARQLARCVLLQEKLSKLQLLGVIDVLQKIGEQGETK
jgi:hypothetical protein